MKEETQTQTPEISPVEGQDVYKYRPDTDCYEYRKYRQSETGRQVEIKSDDVVDDIATETVKIDESVDRKEPDPVPKDEKVRQGLDILCQGDGEAVALLWENLIDVEQVKGKDLLHSCAQQQYLKKFHQEWLENYGLLGFCFELGPKLFVKYERVYYKNVLSADMVMEYGAPRYLCFRSTFISYPSIALQHYQIVVIFRWHYRVYFWKWY